MFGSILSQKNLVVRRTTRPQFLVVITYLLVTEDTRTLEFCYPACTCNRLHYTIDAYEGFIAFCQLYLAADCLVLTPYH